MTHTSHPETQTAPSLPDIFSEGLSALFEAARPAIVQVSTEGRGGGTGIILSAEGQVLTNAHVVGDHQSGIQVRLSDGRTLNAKVLRRDRRLDLAQLQVEASDLPTLTLGASTQLRVGEWVFAIGHPWGQRWVVTAGIVSSLSDIKLAEDRTTRYIKSDVLLAPGNSGGPLLNADGAVVGVNAMIFGGDLAVSIPSQAVENWLREAPAPRAILDISLQTTEIPEASRQGLAKEQQTGVMIVGLGARRLEREQQDLLVGDILLESSGTPITNPAALRRILATQGANGRLPLRLLRGGQQLTLEAATILVEANS